MNYSANDIAYDAGRKLTGDPVVRWYIAEPGDRDVLWRATVRVSTHTVSVDEFDNVTSHPRMRPEVSIFVAAHPILRRTPKGAWIPDDRFGQERFVRTEGTKRFACPTVEEACESLMARYERRRRILAGQLTDTTIALAVMQRKDEDT